MCNKRFVVITWDDAQTIATALQHLLNAEAADDRTRRDLDRGRENVRQIADRLRHETGAEAADVPKLVRLLDTR